MTATLRQAKEDCAVRRQAFRRDEERRTRDRVAMEALTRANRSRRVAAEYERIRQDSKTKEEECLRGNAREVSRLREKATDQVDARRRSRATPDERQAAEQADAAEKKEWMSWVASPEAPWTPPPTPTSAVFSP